MTTIVTEPLHSIEAFEDCERLQKEAQGTPTRAHLSAALLVLIDRSGGAVLGAYDVSDRGDRRLCGCLVDLAADYQGTLGRLTVLVATRGESGERTAHRLRLRERQDALGQGARLIAWPMDPLDGGDALLALHRLGGIAVSYERDLFGARGFDADQDRTTDRVGVEWWIDSPRVAARVDRGLPPHHVKAGLDRMALVTRTAPVGSGARRLLGFEAESEDEILLAEVPGDMDRLRALSHDLVRDWRDRTRVGFEALFDRGYIASGFVQEAGRSFYVFERAEREAFLRRPA